MVELGALLSIWRFEIVAELAVLPAPSVATARMSYSPSLTAVVSNETE